MATGLWEEGMLAGYSEFNLLLDSWTLHTHRSLLHSYLEDKIEGASGELCLVILIPFQGNQSALKSDVDEVGPYIKSAGGQSRHGYHTTALQ